MLQSIEYYYFTNISCIAGVTSSQLISNKNMEQNNIQQMRLETRVCLSRSVTYTKMYGDSSLISSSVANLYYVTWFNILKSEWFVN
jgi:hypothetical protein